MAAFSLVLINYNLPNHFLYLGGFLIFHIIENNTIINKFM